MAEQGRAAYGRAGKAWHDRNRGRSTFSTGQGRVVAVAVAVAVVGAGADSKQGRVGQWRWQRKGQVRS